MNNINEEYMINDAIERIQNKIDSSNRNNRSFSHNIVVHTQITDDFPYAITIVNKHFTDAGYLIQHINKNDCFRVRWDRNKSYLNTQPKKRNTQPNPNKNKPQRAVKDLNQIFKEIDMEIERKARLGYLNCKYHSKFAYGKGNEIISKYTREGFNINCYINGIFIDWHNPTAPHAMEVNKIATTAMINICNKVSADININYNMYKDTSNTFSLNIGCHSKDTIQYIVSKFDPNIFSFEYNVNHGILNVTWR